MLATAEEAININAEVKADKEKAEYYLLRYEIEMRKYEDALHEYINYSELHDDNVGGGKSNLTSAPTERQALKKIEFDRQYKAYRWLKAVEIVQRGLGERKNIFIRVRREAERNNLYATGRGRKGWVVFVQHQYAAEIEQRFILPEVWVGEKTIRMWWNDIVTHTIFAANKIKI